MPIPTVPIISGPYKTFRPVKKNESFIEFEGSTITIPLTVKFEDPKTGQITRTETEPIQLAAFMRLEVLPPYVNGLGTREFQFTIRDWELFGFCPLLNKLFYDDPLGRLRKPTAENPRIRQIVAMTFTLSNHYYKRGDEDDANLGDVESLRIDNLTSHDVCDGCISWEITKTRDGKLGAVFHNKPHVGREAQVFNADRDRQYLLAEAVLGDKAELHASLTEAQHKESNLTFFHGNSFISPLYRPRRPITIHWKFGKNPKPGARGLIRIVSPARSICTAHQRPDVGYPADAADFPARIMYAASYHVFLNDARFIEDQAGVAICDGVHEIPPRDVTVAFDKPHAGRVLGKYLEFGPGCCTGMHEILEEEFLRGQAYARFWRRQPLQPE